MSQAVYREVHPPTAVTHAVEAYFTHPATTDPNGAPPNLILAKGNRLEVYSIRHAGPDTSATGGNIHAVSRLELVAAWPLWGVVVDVGVLRGKKGSGQRDSLLLAFSCAKVSAVAWDDAAADLRVTSLHSFEGTDVNLGEGRQLLQPPQLATDPLGRCAAAVLYGRHVAVLQHFQQDEEDGQEQGAAKQAQAGSYPTLANGYIIPTHKKFGQIRDAVFLHGYTEPLLLLLHEPEPTWAGRYRERRDTCQLSGLSLNFRRKRYPLIWSVQNLPSDCCRLMAVPRGGVLIFSQNLILYHTQGSSCVLAINSNAFAGEVPPRLEMPQPPAMQQWGQPTPDSAAAAAKAATAASQYAAKWATHPHPETASAAAKGAPSAFGLEVEADGAVGSWLSPQLALMGLKSGQLLLVGLRFSGNTATRIQVRLVGASPVLSCAATLTSSLVFLGSHRGDSLLVRVSPPGVAPQYNVLPGNPSPGSLATEPPAKKPRLARLASADMGGMEGSLGRGRSGAAGSDWDLDEDLDLYRSAVGRSSSLLSSDLVTTTDEMLKMELRVMDSLPSLGPLSDFALGKLPLGAGDGQGGSSHSCVLAAAGSDKAGALAVLRRGVVADVITAVPLAAIHGAWTLHYKPTAEVSGAAEVAAAAGAAAEGGAEEEERHAFLLLSSRGVETLVLDARGDELASIAPEDTGFLTTAATLTVGEVLGGAAAVQVTAHVLRLVAGGQLLQELHLHTLLADIQHPAAAAMAEAAAGDGGADMLANIGSVAIKCASVRDPYIALQLSDGCALLLQAVQGGPPATGQSPATTAQEAAAAEEAGASGGRPSLQLLQAAVQPLTGVLAAQADMEDAAAAAAAAGSEVTALCLCVDESGWLTAAAVGGQTQQQQQQQQAKDPQQEQQQQPAQQQQTGAAPARPGSPSGQQSADPRLQQPLAPEGAQQQPTPEAAAAASTSSPGAAAAGAGRSPVADTGGGAVSAVAVAAEEATAMEVDPQQQQQQEQQAGELKQQEAGPKDQRQQLQSPQQPVEQPQEPPSAGQPSEHLLPQQQQQQQQQQQDPDLQSADPPSPTAVPAAAAAVPAPSTEAGLATTVETAASAPDATGGEHGTAPAPSTAPPAQHEAQHGAAAGAAAARSSNPFSTAAAQAATAAAVVKEPAAVYCFVCYAAGSLCIYRLPGMELVWEEPEVVMQHQVLGTLRPPAPVSDDPAEEEEELFALSQQAVPVTEVLVEEFCDSSGAALGVPAAAMPHLLLLGAHGSLLVYKAFTSLSGTLGFKRLLLSGETLGHEEGAPPDPSQPAATPAQRMYRYDALMTPHIPPWMLASHQGALEAVMQRRMPQLMSSGVFVAGARPLWLVASRGGLVAHPMYDEGPVAAMCTFNNSNCPHGFILVAPTADMKICQLPMEVRLDTPWLCHKMPLRAEPLRCTWFPSPNLLALLVTRLAPYKPLLPMEDGSDAAAAAAYAAADAAAKAAGVQELCELQLITAPGSPLLPPPKTATHPVDKLRPPVVNGGWVYPKWSYQFLPGETALCLKPVVLKDFSSTPEEAGEETLLAVGTGSALGEDYPCTGRVLLFQLGTTERLRMEGGSDTLLTARLSLWRDFTGPVTCVDSLRGYLAVTVGPVLELHYKQGSALVKASFFDLPMLASSVSVLKDFIVAADAQYGAWFLRYKESGRQLEGLGCTPDRSAATVAEFLPNANKLNLVMGDASGSISLLAYDRNDPDSRNGQDLVRLGAAHTGSLLTRVTRLRMHLPAEQGNRQALLGSTAQGGFQVISCCWEDALYRRLLSLQGELVYRLRHVAGLNPKAFKARYLRGAPGVGGGLQRTKPLPAQENGLLQGDLLWQYAGLDLRSQVAVADALGVTRADILADLRAMTRATAFL